tara:strand:+ start:1166 stop:1744 length:579 start_codon:yes stop_codon:yes gene_type:complete
MSKIIVPLGVDCGVAKFLKDNELRYFSLPFDWVVSYGGTANIINTKFKNYIHDKSVKFVHQTFPNDIETMNRRIKRFLNLLESDNEIIFLRKGHSEHHHGESNLIKNDLDDCEELYDTLKKNYNNLKFKIILFLVCSDCFNLYTQYDSEKVIVYNVSDKQSRSELIKKYFTDFEKQTGIRKNLENSFVHLNL